MRPLSRLVRPPSPLAKPCSIGATDVPDLEQFLRLIGQRYVLYYPSLARVTGSANAALMLGHMLYWSRKFLTKHPERSGWMWCTAADWTLATGLSRHEQDTARAVLRNTGCVEERLIGVPAKMHYRVDLERLGQLVADFLQRQYIGWVWEESVVRGLLGAPVAYQRLFAEITGSSSAALYLSDLCQMRKYFNGCSSRADVDGTWMELPLGSSATRLARSTKTLRTARNVLLALRLIEERSTRGVQPRIQTRICLQQIMRLAAEKLKNSANSKGVDLQVIDFAGMAETSIPDVPKPANWNGGNEHSRCAETGKLDVPKPANKLAGNVTSINRFSTTKGFFSKQQQLQGVSALRSSCSRDEGNGERPPAQQAAERQTGPAAAKPKAPQFVKSLAVEHELAFPESVATDIRKQACALVADLPYERRQEVIDEWVGKLRRSAPGTVGNQLGYLRGIAKNCALGNFIPTLAIEVAAARKRSAEHAAAMARARDHSPLSSAARAEAKPTNGASNEHQPPRRKSTMPENFMAMVKQMGVSK